MIFQLTNTVTGETIYLPDKKEYIVGRKNCDILLENDQSISREHAKLRVRDDHVTLEDCKSKYHTLYNNVQVDPNVEITLNHMDSIQFGMFKNKYCFESYKFIVAASALSADKKLTLKAALDKCHGKYVDQWSDKCTHLTVEKLTLTIKVLQALVDGKPIVTLDYWSDYAESVEKKVSLPDINKYNRPPIAEHLLRTDFEYKADPRRKTLFENKLFVFLKSSTKKQMEDVIKSCGGKCISWEEKPKTLLDIKKSPLEHLLIKTENDEENVSFDAIVKEFSKQKKRPIPINEIALAIVYCSCDVNCNPSFNKVSEVFGASTPQHKPKRVLAVDTQTEIFLPSTSTERVIPQSVEDGWMESADVLSKHNQKPEMNGIKRPGKEIDGKEAKRVKSGNEKLDDKQTKKDTFMEPQTTKTGIDESGPFKSKPQPPQKRKAVEEPDSGKNVKLNPFSSIIFPSIKKSKTKQEANPFELIRTLKPEKTSRKNHDNPFDSIMNLTSRTTSTVTVENDKPKQEPRRAFHLIPSTSKVSDTSSDKKCSFNLTWRTKSIAKPEPIKEEDPDLAKIAHAFKDCVKVQVLPVYERTAVDVTDRSVDSVDGRRNFKKFRKVKPLKPQVTIIGRFQFKKYGPGDTTGIEVNVIDSEDEGSSSARPKVKKETKPVGKRFVL